jgi:hypothetical protein
MRKWTGPEIVAVVVSVLAAAFTGWQAWEAHQTRIDARVAQQQSREDGLLAQKLQEQQAESAAREAKRSADAAQKSAIASEAATRILEATSHVRVTPRIRVEAAFSPFGNPPNPPRILLWNDGELDASAVTVKLKRWIFGLLPSGSLAMSAEITPIPDWRIGDMAPGQTASIPVSTPSTQADDVPEPYRQERQPLIELIVQYIRTSDAKRYESRSYYFVGSDGKWVSENDPRANNEAVNRVKQKIRSGGFFWGEAPIDLYLDPLHPRPVDAVPSKH